MFTKEMFDGKIHFLISDSCQWFFLKNETGLMEKVESTVQNLIWEKKHDSTSKTMKNVYTVLLLFCFPARNERKFWQKRLKLKELTYSTRETKHHRKVLISISHKIWKHTSSCDDFTHDFQQCQFITILSQISIAESFCH